MNQRPETIDGREVLFWAPGPPEAFEHDDVPDEVAVVRIPNTTDGVMVMAKFCGPYAAHRGEWIANAGERAVVRLLLAEAAAKDAKLRAVLNWLRGNANAEKEPKARAAFIEAHNAVLKIIEEPKP